MVYLYKKMIGGKPYYYLRVSERIRGRILVKDIAYLGTDISKVRENLGKLPQRYKQEIKKAYLTIRKIIDSNYYLEKVHDLKLKSDPYLAREELENVEAARLHFINHFMKLNKLTIRETFENFLIEFAYNTTSIEGNTITLKEANNLLRENLTPKEKSLREIFDLQNTRETFFYLYENRSEINHDLIIKVHDMLMKNIDERKGYRTHDVRVFKSHFETTPGSYVKTDMNLLLEWHNLNKTKLHPLVLALIFHQKLEKIHPFSDGNGRTGRMLFNYMLLLSGYPPVIIRKKNRAYYLNALAEADEADLKEILTGYYKKLVSYIAAEFNQTYWDNFNI